MLTALPAYAGLMAAAKALEQASLATLLADADRSRSLVFRVGELKLDASRQRVDQTVMKQLFLLAEQTGLHGKIAALYAGEQVNLSEGRPALHMYQRSAEVVSGPGFTRLVDFANQVRSSSEIGRAHV